MTGKTKKRAGDRRGVGRSEDGKECNGEWKIGRSADTSPNLPKSDEREGFGLENSVLGLGRTSGLARDSINEQTIPKHGKFIPLSRVLFTVNFLSSSLFLSMSSISCRPRPQSISLRDYR